MKIDKRIKIWQENNIITEEIAKNISEFENNSDDKFLTLYTATACFFVVLGVYHIIKYMFFSSGLYLIVLLILTAICAFVLIYFKKKKSNLFFELFLIIYILLITVDASLIQQKLRYSDITPVWILFSIPAVVYSKIYFIAFFNQFIVFIYISKKFESHLVFYIIATIIYATIMIIANKRKMYKLRVISTFMLLISILGFTFTILLNDPLLIVYFPVVLILVLFLVFSYKNKLVELFNGTFLILNFSILFYIIITVTSYFLRGLLLLLLGLLTFYLHYYFYKKVKSKK